MFDVILKYKISIAIVETANVGFKFLACAAI